MSASYGLWPLVIINSLVFIIFAFSVYAIAMAMLEAAAVIYMGSFLLFFPLSHFALVSVACNFRCLFFDSLAVDRTGVDSFNSFQCSGCYFFPAISKTATR